MYYISRACVEGLYSSRIEERSQPLRVILVVQFTERKRYKYGTRILGERITAEVAHRFQLQSPSSSQIKALVLHAISLLRRPQISNVDARRLSDSASTHINHAIATGTKSLELVVSIEAIDELMINELDMTNSRSFEELQLSEESREDEIPSEVLEESEELAQEHRFGEGSSSNAIETLKMEKYHVGDANESCTICIEDFLAEEDVAIMQCDHAFHKECIVQWLMNSNSCPLCRVKQQEP